MSKNVSDDKQFSINKIILFCLSILALNYKPIYAETIYADLIELDTVRPKAENIEDFNNSIERLYQQQNVNEPGTDFLTGLMSNGKPQRITPDPNESIDLFSGAFHLVYKDISIPVAPGLSMDFIRGYNSELYDKFPFEDLKNHQHNMLQNGWHMHSGYFEKAKKCEHEDNRCSGVFIDNLGIKHPLLIDSNESMYRSSSKDHYQLSYGNNTIVITAPNGFKYISENLQYLDKVVRNYITRVETPDGHHVVNYHYSGTRLVRITSSDPAKVIDIIYKDIETRPNHKHADKVKAPVAVYFNKNLMASYTYTFVRKKKHVKPTLVLTGVKLANDLEWNYQYKIIELGIDGKQHTERTDRVFLEQVTHPDLEVTKYDYSMDKSLRYNQEIYASRLALREHIGQNKIDDGRWKFELSEGPITYGTATRQVKVINPLYTTDYLFNSYQKNNLWKLGTLAEITIFKDHNSDSNNIIQQEKFVWHSAFHGKYKFIATAKNNNDFSDKRTYRAILSEKSIMRAGDNYNNVYSDYDEFDNPRLITQTSGSKTRLIKQNFLNLTNKNILGLVQSLSVNNKIIINNEYDSNGFLTKSENLGKIKKYKYQNGIVSEYIDAQGNITEYKNYNSGIPELVYYPDSSQEHNAVNQFGLIEKETNKNGFTQSYIYNNYGQLISSILPDGEVTHYEYKIFDKYTKNGNYLLHQQYNIYNQLILQNENNENKLEITYDAMGNKIFQSQLVDVNSSSNRGHYYNYDSLGRLLSDCEGASVNDKSRCTYNQYLQGNRVKTIFPNGEYVIYTYQAYGDPDSSKLISIEQEGRKTIISRGDLGNVLSVSQGNITKTYNYDDNLNLVKYQEPETGETVYQYDKIGNLILKMQGGVKTSYQYNSKNYQLEHIKYTDESYNEEFQYDKMGNIVKTIKGDVETSYSYNQNNKLLSEKLLLNLGNERKVLNIQYIYDHFGNLSAMNYPDGTAVDYAPNYYGLPTKVGKYINQIKYYSNHHWSDYSLANGVVAKASLDDSMRMNRIQYGSLDLNFTYDSNNNLERYNLLDHNNRNFDYKLEFTYDKTGRIKTSMGPWGKLDYTYDSNDNILAIRNLLNTKAMAGDIKLNYASNRLNTVSNNSRSLTAADTFVYDNFGNIKQDANNRYLYGADRNLLTAMGKENATYGYDVKNNRVLKNIGRNKVITLYNNAGQAIYEVNQEKKTETKYIYFNGKRIAEDIKQGNNNIVNYYYNDYLGNPIAMANAKGETLWREIYQPFGAKYFDNQGKYGFIGKEIDKNNLSYFGARYYNSQFGRFMAPDSVAVDPENPASFNRYAYSANNPYKYVDEDGRNPVYALIAEVVIGSLIGLLSELHTQDPYKIAVATIAGGIAGFFSNPLAAKVSTYAVNRGLSAALTRSSVFASDIIYGTSYNTMVSVVKDGDFSMQDTTASSLINASVTKMVNPMGLKLNNVAEVLLYRSNQALLAYVGEKLYESGSNKNNLIESTLQTKKNRTLPNMNYGYEINNQCGISSNINFKIAYN